MMLSLPLLSVLHSSTHASSFKISVPWIISDVYAILSFILPCNYIFGLQGNNIRYYNSTIQYLYQLYTIYNMQKKIATLATIEKYLYQITIIAFLNISFAMLIAYIFQLDRMKSYSCNTRRRQSNHGNLLWEELSELM